MFICTSNLYDILDTAFLDRCSVIRHIDTPSADCTYEILRVVVNELARTGSVEAAPALGMYPLDNEDSVIPTNHLWTDSINPLYALEGSPSEAAMLGMMQNNVPQVKLPKMNEVLKNNGGEKKPYHHLYEIARFCSAAHLSGRTLRRLPITAMATYCMDSPCYLYDLLLALKDEVKNKVRTSYPLAEARQIVQAYEPDF